MPYLVWRLGALPWVCGSLLLTGCPDDPVPATETSDGSSSDDATTTTTLTTSTTVSLDSSSGPATTTTVGDTEASTGPGTTTTPTSSSATVGDTGEIAVCGNNVIEGDEVCDLAQINGETCESLGYEGGQLGCLLTCQDYNLLGCFICGNEVIDIAEDCEDSVPEEVTCQSLGFEDGWITCGSDCLYDLSECSICGDGIASGPEQCDGIDFSGETCASQGFDGGNLACNLLQCAFVYSGCSGGQYLQNFEASLNIPIEFDVDAVAPWVVVEAMPIAGARSARSGALPVGGTTNLTLQAAFAAAGTVSFDHRESTAAGFDFLYFYVDGIQMGSWSGINAAANYMGPVAAGNHTFQWRFFREGFINGGTDQVWVDNITLVGGVPL
ncbi:hypothetical protein [Paraliomyxa miuraensis]|uniref:hypothetical protein n=1 Tax=Paraliomyxa miuraensis TaxID=376150 RepID=UPI0022567A73|nr:hypothetical protein [Paraliomyxa miuraensis]MCX4242202.1 hypothetical protein [Paraliomyxa miuraensis]